MKANRNISLTTADRTTDPKQGCRPWSLSGIVASGYLVFGREQGSLNHHMEGPEGAGR